MKGDVIIVEEHHYRAASAIAPKIIDKIKDCPTRYTITVAGESGSGKSETAKALSETLEKEGIKCITLAQDDYFIYPPKTNDKERRKDISWVGANEVKLDLLNSHFKAGINGQEEIKKPLVDYDADKVEEEIMSLKDIKVIIAEGTYTSLLKDAMTRVFIARNRLQTLEARKKRNRGNEVGDPFIEDVLKIEHKVISPHKYLSNFLITNEYEVEFKDD